MKLQMLTVDEYDGEEVWEYKDTYIDPTFIRGWYLPNQSSEHVRTLNLFFDGQLITVIYTDELRRYLDKNITYPEKHETK